MDRTYPSPITSCWKFVHCLPYLIGGITFSAGSVCYLPAYAAYVLGGWLFTIGSAAFLFADVWEWWKNNRIGCAFDIEYIKDYEDQLIKTGCYPKRDAPEYAYFYWRFKRAETGLNFFASVTGSFLYLVGSVLFIPSLNAIVTGTWVFIYGSAVIAFAQSWKLYRHACKAEPQPQSQSQSQPPRTTDESQKQQSQSQALRPLPSFHCPRMFDDVAIFGIDFGAGIGGVFYLFGSVVFLPVFDTSDARTVLAAGLFICGGLSFFMSGLCMLYKYFIEKGEEDALLPKANKSQNSSSRYGSVDP